VSRFDVMTKATHQGTCQHCGRVQKLPNRVLALDGYTKAWGSFSGICPGSGYLPFELDSTYAAESIRWATQQIEALRKRAAQIREPATEPTATVRIYRNTYPFWDQVRVQSEVVNDFRFFYCFDREGKKNRLDFWGAHRPATELEAADQLRDRYARAVCDDPIKELTFYRNWQEDRVGNWKPRPLKEIK
jgi:hypothetical protein